jgi:hypothetical protein
MAFEVIGRISGAEVIARGKSIRDLPRLVKAFGPGRWRKMKGRARVRLTTDEVRLAELHWYEAHGVGKKRVKIKRFLD